MTPNQQTLASRKQRVETAFNSFALQFQSVHGQLNDELPEMMDAAGRLAGWLKLVSYSSGVFTNAGNFILSIEQDHERAAAIAQAIDAALEGDLSLAGNLPQPNQALVQYILAGLQFYGTIKTLELSHTPIEASGLIEINNDGTASVTPLPEDSEDPAEP